jgi:hypothetical protein
MPCPLKSDLFLSSDLRAVSNTMFLSLAVDRQMKIMLLHALQHVDVETVLQRGYLKIELICTGPD